MRYRKVGVIHFVKVGPLFLSFGISRKRKREAPQRRALSVRTASIITGAAVSYAVLVAIAGGF